MPKSNNSQFYDEPSVPLPRAASIEKCGWLQKWTNYIKGYRQRWFVLDSNGNLSYYRNQSEVGLACRGSLNLQEARIHSDEATNSLIISASSQAFHLKAQNDVDRKQWLTALEYARHRAIKQDEEDDEADSGPATDFKDVMDKFNNALNDKLNALKTAEGHLKKTASDLNKLLGKSEEGKQYQEKSHALKMSVSSVLTASDDLVAAASKESRSLARCASNEHEQRVRLQEQLEIFAKQHSNLERAAYSNPASTPQQPPYVSDDDEEQFHDATDDMDELRAADNERKSGSSRQGSFCGDDTDRDIFNAEVVSPRGDVASMDHPVSTEIVPRQSRTKRRESIPERLQGTISLWSIMRNCIGKELTRIPMPVNFNEPLSVLQRITEDLEYAYLLDRAAEKADSLEQICYVAAYSISCYSTTGNRTTKPFNPLLGETYECDRTEDLGWRSLAEQVSHHPPATAHHAEGTKWVMYQDFTMQSRFRGKYLSVTPTGHTLVKFKNSANHYSYRKITTTVHNIIVGKLWIDNHGEAIIENHATGEKCILKFHAYSYFSAEKPRKVSGVVKDRDGVVRWLIQGYWDKYIDILQVSKHEKGAKNLLETNPPRRVWTINPPYKNSDKMYHFTKLAIELNEPDESVAPTDSRRRPDQRLMEEGKWEDANRVKNDVEEKQRVARRKREIEQERAMQQGLAYPEYEPAWFEKKQDEYTGSVIHTYKGGYWEHKTTQDWTPCHKIF